MAPLFSRMGWLSQPTIQQTPESRESGAPLSSLSSSSSRDCLKLAQLANSFTYHWLQTMWWNPTDFTMNRFPLNLIARGSLRGTLHRWLKLWRRCKEGMWLQLFHLFIQTQNQIAEILTILWSLSTHTPIIPQVICGIVPIMVIQVVLLRHQLAMYVHLHLYLITLTCFPVLWCSRRSWDVGVHKRDEVFISLFTCLWGCCAQEWGSCWFEGESREVLFLCSSLPFTECFCSLKITDTFAFSAERLITHHPAVWMIGYADQVIVSGQPSRDAIGPLLYSSLVGRHTLVVYLNKTESTDKGVVFSLFQYIWEQGSHRPNTHSYPVACFSCNTIYSWQRIAETDGAGFTLTCKTKLADGRKCPGKWEVPARPESSAVQAPHVGTWRVVLE